MGWIHRLQSWVRNAFRTPRLNQDIQEELEFHVEAYAADLRRQGVGKYLLAQLLRYLQEQYFGVAEVQVTEDMEAALKMFRTIGFSQVDVGYMYKKAPG